MDGWAGLPARPRGPGVGSMERSGREGLSMERSTERSTERSGREGLSTEQRGQAGFAAAAVALYRHKRAVHRLTATGGETESDGYTAPIQP